jgi:hypothetical protein
MDDTDGLLRRAAALATDGAACQDVTASCAAQETRNTLATDPVAATLEASAKTRAPVSYRQQLKCEGAVAVPLATVTSQGRKRKTAPESVK